MTDHSLLRIVSRPSLRRPVLIAAFAGWNDAGQAATFALRSLQRSWSAARFAEIDAEEFFDFTETRPLITLGAAGQRSLEWPENAFFYRQMPDAETDVVLLIGTEPQLRWRTFCRLVTDLAADLDASSLLTCGALLADVPHTVDPRVTGYATTHALTTELRSLGVRYSSYEGPTGILGALHDAWSTTRRPALSLWSNVPHYISAAPNPQAALALMHHASALLKVQLPLGPLETQAGAFSRQIDDALNENPEAREYVRQLEAHFASENPGPTAPELIEELERYLRTRPPPGESSQG